MNTKLIRLKYYRWDGDPIKAKLAFKDEAVNVDFANGDLILKAQKDDSKFIRIARGLFVVGLPNPFKMQYMYYRLSKPQLNQVLELSNRGENLALV